MTSWNSAGDFLQRIVHLDDVHVQHQGGVGRNNSECSRVTVRHLVVHHDHPPLTLATSVQPQLPAGDDLSRSQDDGVLTLVHFDSTSPRSGDLGGDIAGRKVFGVLEVGHYKILFSK